MIFDMTRRSSGGGSGPSASDAILTVTVPTGSTVTATKGGTTLTPTMWVQAADNTLDCALFVISPSLFDAQNPWTVTATLGTDTTSDTVTIDSNEQYDVQLSFWNGELYDSGKQFVSVTGGWSATAYSEGVTFESDRISITVPTGAAPAACVATENAIDLTDWHTLKATVNMSTFGTGGNAKIGVGTNRPTNDTTSLTTQKQFSNTGLQTVSLDITSLSGLYYVAVTGYRETGYYKKVWLE